ncbi:MAG: lipoyl(octanoyl) transferase LipB [Alphaproteobacteria bacterium]|nr:lipoyl(octanoyl) transferase LipB [Alphaproteobacteria bacterium]
MTMQAEATPPTEAPLPVEWRISETPVPYETAIAEMEARVAAIRAGTAPELVWLLEHPPLYTAGTSADPTDLTDPDRFPVFKTGRGGQYTYHGPGQRVAYVMLDLKRRTGGKPDVRHYVWQLEEWIIRTLAAMNVTGERRDGRVGIWVCRTDRNQPLREDKIAAIGVRIRQWVTFHGISLNVEPDLDHFAGIVPCGISEHGVTSLVDLGLPVTLADADAHLRQTFDGVFDGVLAE